MLFTGMPTQSRGYSLRQVVARDGVAVEYCHGAILQTPRVALHGLAVQSNEDVDVVAMRANALTMGAHQNERVAAANQ